PRLRPDRVGHVDQLDPAAAIRRQPGQRPVAAFQAEAQRSLVRLAAEDEAVVADTLDGPAGPLSLAGSLSLSGRRDPVGGGPAEGGTQDLHGQLLAPGLGQGQPAHAAAGPPRCLAAPRPSTRTPD